MSIALRSVGSRGTTAPGAPAGAANNDIIILAVDCNVLTSGTTPSSSGFTLLGIASSSGATGRSLAFLGKRSAGSEPGSYTVVAPTGGSISASEAYAYSGVTTSGTYYTTPNIVGAATSSTATPAVNITDGAGDMRLLGFVTSGTSVTISSGIGGWTEVSPTASSVMHLISQTSGGGASGSLSLTMSAATNPRCAGVISLIASTAPVPGIYEWNGTAEVLLTPYEWNGTTEIALTSSEYDGILATELWASMASWGGSGTAVGNKMYNAANGVCRNISAFTTSGKKLMVRAVGTIPASSAKYIYFGFSNDTAGGSPSAGGTNAFMIGINSSSWAVLKGTNVTGSVTNTPSGASPGAGDYIFTGIIDENGISLSIAPKNNPGQIVASTSILRSQMPSPQPVINNVILSNSDTTNAHYWGPLMILDQIAPPPVAGRTPGGVTLFGATEPIHINRRDPSTGVRHMIQIPGDYNPQVGMQLVEFLHWSLSATGAMVYSDSRMTNVLSALLGAGYAVLSSDNGPATTAGGTQDGYGNQAGIDDYAAAVAWTRAHFKIRSLFLLGASQGGMFVENILASHLSNRIEDIAAVASISPGTDTNLLAQNATFTAAIEGAFSVGSTAALTAALLANDLNPIAQSAYDLRGCPHRYYVALDDPLTPKADHIDPMVATVGTYAPEMSVVTVLTGGHLAATLFQGSDLVSFYNTYKL